MLVVVVVFFFSCVWMNFRCRGKLITDVKTFFSSSSPRRLSEEDANVQELLVPIRLEFPVDHHTMRDTFIWNLHG